MCNASKNPNKPAAIDTYINVIMPFDMFTPQLCHSVPEKIFSDQMFDFVLNRLWHLLLYIGFFFFN